MKFVLALAFAAQVSLASTVIFAQPNPWEVPVKPDDIKTAVIGAINWTTLKCSGTATSGGAAKAEKISTSNVREFIGAAQGVFIKSDGSQPLVSFKYTEKKRLRTMTLNLLVTTSSDKKAVTAIELEQTVSASQVQNSGTIDHPINQTVWQVVERTTGSCN